MCLKLWVPPSIFLPELGFCNIPEQSSADDDYDDDDDCTDYHGGGRDDDDSGGGDGDGEGDYGCEMVMKMLEKEEAGGRQDCLNTCFAEHLLSAKEATTEELGPMESVVPKDSLVLSYAVCC
eukprot:s1107_g7.t1